MFNRQKETKVKVSVARKEDLGEIVAYLMVEPFKMSGWPLKEFKPDLDKVSSAVLDSFINSQIFFVRNKLGKIEGCVLLVEESPWWTSQNTVVSDMAFIVSEDATTSEIAKHLLLACKAYAKIKGLKLMISLYSNEKTRLKERFLNVMGFETIGFVSQMK